MVNVDGVVLGNFRTGINGRDLNRDSKGSKVLSLFLPELAQRLPHQMLSKISSIKN